MTTQYRSSLQAMVTHHAAQTTQSLFHTLLIVGSLFSSFTGVAANAQSTLPTRHVYQSPQSSHLSPQSTEMLRIEAEIWHQINQQRQRYGLSPLRVDERLTQAARAYSKQMAEHNFYSHTGLRGDTFRTRVEAQGVRAKLVGENIVRFPQCRHPSTVAVRSWMKSTGHRQNILMSQMTETGIGIWKHGNTYYMTQLFVDPKDGGTTRVSSVPLN